MCARPYRLGRREVSVEETRQSVIAAAYSVLSVSGFHRATLDDVAVMAGVARATVYYQFKSKFGLLAATIEHVLNSSANIAQLRAAREHPDAKTGLRLFIKEVCRFWARDDVFFRNIIGLAAIDREAAQAVDQYDFRRRDLLVWLVKRLEDQGQLASAVTQKQALDTVWLLTSFGAFDHLHTRSKLSVKRSAEVLTGLADSVLKPELRATPAD